MKGWPVRSHETWSSELFPRLLLNTTVPLAALLRFSHNKIHHRRRILRPDRKMSLAGLHDDRHLAAELLVALFRNSRLAVKPGVKLAAHMQDRHARLGQRLQIIQRLLLFLSALHDAAQDGILSVDA